MKQNNITLTLTDKEFEIVRRAIVRYANAQIGLSKSWGTTEEDDSAAIRANIALGIQTKCGKKIKTRPELEYISIF